MRDRVLDALLLALAVVLGVLAVKRAADASPVYVAVPVPPLAPRSDHVSDSVALVDANETLVSTNPFRLNHLPALIRVGQPINLALESRTMAPTPQVVRPTLTLKGIVGGPPWSAVVEGLPGTQGPTMIRDGTALGDLTVVSITRDTVTIAARDTTWKLTVKQGQR